METRGREKKPRRPEAAGRDANAIGFGGWAHLFPLFVIFLSSPSAEPITRRHVAQLLEKNEADAQPARAEWPIVDGPRMPHGGAAIIHLDYSSSRERFIIQS
jgi:hypothetical protein